MIIAVQVRYNRRLVDHFCKTRLKKFAFYPWRRFSKVSRAVNIKFRTKMTNFLKSYMVAWKAIVNRFQMLRQKSIENWKGYAMVMVTKPFKCWASYSANAATIRNQQNILVSAYVRWKKRQWIIKILRTWRHQALYGGVEGLYSRTNISKSLGEQKSMCTALQKLLTRQTVELEECHELVNKETTTRKNLEDRIVAKDNDLEKLKMKMHHMNQELRRLHAVIEVRLSKAITLFST